MQARARAAMAVKGLTYKALSAQIGRSAGAVGRALNDTPAKASPTLKDIFNYLCVPERPALASAVGVARQLAAQAPESAALLAAVFEQIAALLRSASVSRPGRTRTPLP